MTEQERIVTDVGLILPRLSWPDRIFARLAFPLFAIACKAALRNDSQFKNEPELRKQAETLINDVKILFDVIGDFERHRISGHVIRSNEGGVTQPDPDFDILTLIRARQKAKKRKLSQ